MNSKIIITLVILGLGAGLGALILQIEPKAVTHEEEGPAEEEFERGPHNGRLLRDGDTAIEMTIYEEGVPPEFRIYAYLNDKPVEPAKVDLSVELSRLGGVKGDFSFVPESDYLRGQTSVVEPHSFDVNVSARIDNKAHTWAYQSYEGRVEITPEAATAGGISTARAGPAQIRETAKVTGHIIIDPAKSAHIKARFPGVLRELRKSLGERVTKGDTIAMVESNDSLQAYAVKSPVDGVVLSQNARVGEMVADLPIAEVGDMTRLIAELQVFPRDAAKLKVGQPVRVSMIDSDTSVETQLALILPTFEVGSQAVPIRVYIENSAQHWRPGMLVEAEITTGTKDVALAVRTSGLQRFRDFDVVFAKVDDTYEVRMLELGVQDGEFVEVLGGLASGTVYVTENSFLIKADIEKSGASHDH